MPCEFLINYFNLYLLPCMNLGMNHLFMWMIVCCWPRHVKNVLIMYLPQYICYRNWGLSYTQQSLYLYQHKKFLGFKIDTLNMTLTLTSNKKENIRNIAAVLLLKQCFSIRTLGSFLGNIVFSFEAVPNGNLYYRNIKQQKLKH